LSVAHERQPADLAAGVELETQRLKVAEGGVAVWESDHKRHHAMYTCATPREQQPRPFLTTGHQRLAFSVEYKNSQIDSSLIAAGIRPARLPLRAL
jgi:hypothetical protein